LTRRNIRLANKLSAISNDEELKGLTNSQNSTMFCIAFLILAKRDNPFVQSFFEKHSRMTDEEWLEWEKTTNSPREINVINRKHKSDVVLICTKSSFLDDVMIEKKHLSKIK
jgi:hypothetical protein